MCSGCDEVQYDRFPMLEVSLFLSERKGEAGDERRDIGSDGRVLAGHCASGAELIGGAA